jgi:hypothetical protein
MNDSEKSNPLKQWLIPIAIIIGFIAHGWITTERYKIYKASDGYELRLNTMTGEVASLISGHVNSFKVNED